MRVEKIEALPITLTFASIFGGLENVPANLLTPASHFKRFKRTGQHAVIVKVTTDDGLVGFGEGFGIPAPEVPATAVEKVIAPLIVGQDLTDPTAIYADIESYLINLGHSRGALMEALAAVDIALWDIAGRAAGRSVAELLGGEPGPVETYASPVAFNDDPTRAALAAREYVDQGFRAIKTKIGDDLVRDEANLRAIRDEIGPDVRLLVDANGGFDVAGAIAFAERVADLDIGWLEEPVPVNDIEGLREVRRSVPIPIAWGENEFTLNGIRNAVLREAVDVVQPNVTRAGGISGSKRIAELAAAHGIAFAPHGVGTGLGVTAMLHVCRAAASFDVYEANRLLNPLRDEVIKVRTPVTSGRLRVEDAPGLGIDVPWEQLTERFGAKRAHD